MIESFCPTCMTWAAWIPKRPCKVKAVDWIHQNNVMTRYYFIAWYLYQSIHIYTCIYIYTYKHLGTKTKTAPIIQLSQLPAWTSEMKAELHWVVEDPAAHRHRAPLLSCGCGPGMCHRNQLSTVRFSFAMFRLTKCLEHQRNIIWIISDSLFCLSWRIKKSHPDSSRLLIPSRHRNKNLKCA